MKEKTFLFKTKLYYILKTIHSKQILCLLLKLKKNAYLISVKAKSTTENPKNYVT